MEVFSNLLMGFQVAFTPMNFLFALAGVVIGQIVGILPGLGPIVTIAVLLPFTYNLDPIAAIVAFSGIYYGSQFGGAISAILVNAPGTEAAIITAMEGYPMARKGQAGKALAAAAISSFVGGIIGTVLLTVLSKPITHLVVAFAAPEYLALMIFALVCISGFSENTTLPKCCFSICVGLAIGTIGMDSTTGAIRLTFGNLNLYEGVSFVILAIGMFALAEVFRNLHRETADRPREKMVIDGKVSLSRKEILDIVPTQVRSSISGFLIGVLPGVGSTTSTPLAYLMEKSLYKDGDWGNGEIRGVAAGESSNNSCAMGALVPLLTMGIPGSGTTAIMLSAFMILGIQPGPLLFQNDPEMVWGLIASFFIGTCILLAINLPLVKYCAKLVQIPSEILFLSVLLLSVVGAYSVSQRTFDIWMILLFGVVGLFFSKARLPLTPCLVSLLLGELMEVNLARSVVICDHSVLVFLQRPIVAVFLALAVLVLAGPRLYRLAKRARAS